MKRPKDLSIAAKVLVAPAALVLALAVISVMAFFGALDMRETLNDTNAVLQKITLIHRFSALSERVQSDVFRTSILHSLDAPAEETELMQDRLQQGFADLDTIYGQMDLVWDLDAEERAIFDRMRSSLETFQRQAQEAVAVSAADPAHGADLVRATAVPFAELSGALADFRDYQEGWIAQTETVVARRIRTVAPGVLISALVILLSGVSATWVVSRRLIAQPIEDITGVLGALAEGDLSVEVGDLGRRDEIGAMARAVEVFRQDSIEKRQLQVALEQHREHLEELVDARTSDLTLAIDQLERSEERLLLAIGGTSGALWDEELDPDATFDAQLGKTHYSSEAAQLLGYGDAAELAASYKAWYAHVHPEDRAVVAQRQRDHFEGRTAYLDQEYRVQGTDGSIRWIHGRSRILRDGRGRPVRWIGIDWDVTARKEAEIELRQHREHLEDLVAERTDELQLLIDISRQLSESLDIDVVYGRLHVALSRIMDCDVLTLSTFDPSDGLIRCAYASIGGEPQDVSDYPPLPLTPEQRGTQSVAIRSGEALLLRDYHGWMATSQTSTYIDKGGAVLDQEEAQDEGVTRSALIVPMKLEGQIVGVIQVLSNQLDAYTESDLLVLESVASQVLVATNNALLFQQAQGEIAERRQAEERLEKSERDLRRAQQIARVGSWIWDTKTNEVKMSDAMYGILGLESGASLPLIDAEAKTLHPDDRARVFDTISTATKERTPYTLDYRIYRVNDGQERHLHVETEIEGSSPSGHLTFFGTVQDVTDRLRTEVALRESEEKLRNIVENSTNTFYSHTPEHVITYLSPQVEGLLGYAPEEAMVAWTELATEHPINLRGLELTDRAIESGETQPPYELELKHKLGHAVQVEVREAPLVVDGNTVAMVGALVDISDRKQAQAKMQQQLDELQRWYDLMLGRETRVLDLKVEINELLLRLDEPPRYASAEDGLETEDVA